MITQSYTSFLNNVHQKANIHISLIKVNESTGQQVNKSTSRGPMGLIGSDWARLGRKGLKKENTH